jgi:hypothetical protein
MSVEKAIICDGCTVLMAAGRDTTTLVRTCGPAPSSA